MEELDVIHRFPVTVRSSALFYSLGVKVTRAILRAPNGTKFGELVPVESIAEKDTFLHFFTDKPFHCGLATEWMPIIEIHTSDDTEPVLKVKIVGSSLTWEDAPPNATRYVDDITAYGVAGPKKARFVYTKAGGGFLRSSCEVASDSSAPCASPGWD
jgi:hypothetical protein